MHAPDALGIPLAIFAGAGELPRVLANASVEAGRPTLVLRIENEADADFGAIEAETIRYGELGRVLRLLRARRTRHVVFAGHVNRPGLGAIRPDWGGVKLMPRLARLLTGGDDTLLRGVASLLAEEGLTLVSPLDIAPALSAPPGVLAGVGPNGDVRQDITVGLLAARRLGELDAGQAVVAHGGRAIALEGLEGTDALLARAGSLRSSGRWRAAAPSGVLVKIAKPDQDMRLDVPTIGPRTIEIASEAGLAGIAVEAGRVLLLDRPAVIRMAEERSLFVWGAA